MAAPLGSIDLADAVVLEAGISGQIQQFGVVRVVGLIHKALELCDLLETTILKERINYGDIVSFALVLKDHVDSLVKAKSGSAKYVKQWQGIMTMQSSRTHLGTIRKYEKVYGVGNYLKVGGLEALDQGGIDSVQLKFVQAAGEPAPADIRAQYNAITDDKIRRALLATIDNPKVNKFAVSSPSYDPNVAWPFQPDVARHQASFKLLTTFLAKFTTDDGLGSALTALTATTHKAQCDSFVRWQGDNSPRSRVPPPAPPLPEPSHAPSPLSVSTYTFVSSEQPPVQPQSDVKLPSPPHPQHSLGPSSLSTFAPHPSPPDAQPSPEYSPLPVANHTYSPSHQPPVQPLRVFKLPPLPHPQSSLLLSYPTPSPSPPSSSSTAVCATTLGASSNLNPANGKRSKRAPSSSLDSAVGSKKAKK
ncbi:hypothetical protein JCM5353_000434 [Sporobolomyces roseus]